MSIPTEEHHGNAGSGSKDLGAFAPSGKPRPTNKQPGRSPDSGALAAFGGYAHAEKNSGLAGGRNSLDIQKPEYPMKGEGASNGPTSEPGHPQGGGDSKPKASGVGRPEDN